MNPKPNVELAVSILIVVLSLIALWLATVAPQYFADNQVVYQGF
ncbi:MAG TPA: hypothetical protein VK742_15565 [Candidatus Sulfotelmatobacter sp.]|nr:hypothetical protein [Candidatus Sulfotelmatobacter sp.]